MRTISSFRLRPQSSTCSPGRLGPAPAISRTMAVPEKVFTPRSQADVSMILHFITALVLQNSCIATPVDLPRTDGSPGLTVAGLAVDATLSGAAVSWQYWTGNRSQAPGCAVQVTRRE